MNSSTSENKGQVPRQPIVVVMGHVDHGKTTLLDHIRKASVALREAGGITQAVGAYEIEHPSTSSGQAPKKITFIDTPGHEAFSKMRSRGAQVADLAILVVAADEGVKPQTKEAIKTLRDSKTPFVVAITKTDKPSADIERVKNELTANDVFLEGYGGDISYQPISAKSGEGVSDILDLLILASEMENLSYDPAAPAEGFVLETQTNKNRGTEASVIVKNGVLRQGDAIATPSAKGRVKILENYLGKQTKEVPAGAPALIVGFEALPQVGEIFQTGASADETVLVKTGPAETTEPEKKQDGALVTILKASDAGSLEVLSEIMKNLNPEKPLRIIAEGIGDITENDVKLAVSSGAAIVGFKNSADKAAKALAQAQAVVIVTSDIVYHLVTAVEDLVKKAESAVLVGELEILAAFNVAKLDKQVVGGKVTKGIFKNRSQFVIERAGERVGQGRVTNIQEQKKDVSQVLEGKETGVLVSAGIEIKTGDKLIIEELRVK